MGLLDRFRKEEVTGTKVLVCCLDPRFEDQVRGDGQAYRSAYPAVETAVLPSIGKLNEAIAKRYDVVHFLGNLANGEIADSSGARLSGSDLIQRCCDADVKLLWMASANPADAYKGFNARGKKINAVLTLDRKGHYFTLFLKSLFAKMVAGEAMPAAWSELSAENTKSVQPDVPECIVSSGRAAVRLQ